MATAIAAIASARTAYQVPQIRPWARLGTLAIIPRQAVGVVGMQLLQVEQIRAPQKGLSKQAVARQVNQFHNQPHTLLSTPLGIIAHYAS